MLAISSTLTCASCSLQGRQLAVEPSACAAALADRFGLYGELFLVFLQLSEAAGDFAFELLLERIQGVDVCRQACDV